MTSDERALDLSDLGDRYAIDATIGTGGMASVVTARDRTTNERVAIKRLHDHLADDPHFEKILLDEARLQTLVRHPNVVATLAVGRMEGRLTLVLELVDGASLARLLRLRGPLDPSVVVEIGCQMLAGLGAAHAACDEDGRALDLVHRDVSPQNALVDRDGIVKLADFGIARARSRLQTTTEGRIKGKIAYMSPEQIEGQSLDARSDLFSTGAILWELCTGERLFRGESEGELLRRVLSHPIPRLTDVRGDLPPALDDVIRKSLARDRAERWPRASEMSAALEAAHPRAGRAALSAIVPELQSVHVVTKGTSAFAPTADVAAPILDDQRERTEVVSRGGVRPSPEGTRSPSRIALAGIVLVAGAGAVIAGVTTSSAPSSVRPVPTTPLPIASEIPMPSASPSASAAMTSTSTSASATVATTRPWRPSSRPSGASSSAPSASASTASTSRPSCDPPYRVDERGVRVFRTECL